MESRPCPDCSSTNEIDRRQFLRFTAGAAAAGLWLPNSSLAAPTLKSTSETKVAQLYSTLSDTQKKAVCFDWDHKHPERGLLRTHVSNNWHITEETIDGEFFTGDQKALIEEIFKGIFNPDWHDKIYQQLRDDTDGQPWGADQNIAIFGTPGSEKFEFVMTGRHLTIRCDGNTQEHVAFGGPIFHGHAASGFNEKVGHPGNIFWSQAQLANKVYQILDGKQQKVALIEKRPGESAVSFRGEKGEFPGLPISEMSSDQKEAIEKTLTGLLEPYREEDREEVLNSLKKNGGIEKCSLAFYQEGDLGEDKEWDNWRIEGPSFVWYFRGFPHVHLWINIADSSEVKLNARG